MICQRGAKAGVLLEQQGGFLLVLLSVALILLPGPNTARANTLTPVDDVLSAVGGNVYISRTPNGDTGQFWADGAWHDFAELDPADKDTQDGPSVSIGNGWYISWDHAKYGGTYLVWRYWCARGAVGGQRAGRVPACMFRPTRGLRHRGG